MLNGDDKPLTLTRDGRPESRGVRKALPRGQGTEAQKVLLKLNGFNFETSKAWQLIQLRYSSGITQNELKSIALVVSHLTNIALDRDTKRDFKLLVKWFDDNFEVVCPILFMINLRDKNNQIINLQREINESK